MSYTVQRMVGRRAPSPRTDLFSTTFPATENPLSSGGKWIQGGNTGLDWQNTQSTGGSPGIAFGTGSSPSNANDNISVLTGLGISTTKHYSRFTVNKVAGYTPPDSHEIELLGLFNITAHSAWGYEMSFGFGTNLQPVRWNGALNDFDVSVFTTLSGSGSFVVADGDDVKVIFDATSGSPVITVFLNGVQQVQWTDTTAERTDTTAGKITSGAPGMGFFARPGAGLDLSKYCNRYFEAGSV